MTSLNVMVAHDLGLHIRPEALIAQTAEAAKADVWIVSGDRMADAKSVLSILTLVCAKGSVVTVKVDSQEDREILDLFQKSFPLVFNSKL